MSTKRIGDILTIEGIVVGMTVLITVTMTGVVAIGVAGTVTMGTGKIAIIMINACAFSALGPLGVNGVLAPGRL